MTDGVVHFSLMDIVPYELYRECHGLTHSCSIASPVRATGYPIVKGSCIVANVSRSNFRGCESLIKSIVKS